MIFIYNFLSILQQLFIMLIFIRVLVSWVGIRNKFLYDTTEWVLSPLRLMLPPLGGFLDLSPLIAVLLIEFAGNFFLNLIAGSYL